MNYRKRVMLVLCIVVMTAILPALLLVLYVDPFRIYHQSLFPDVPLRGNQRYQNAGLINTYLADPAQGYDSVIIGTSMSQNFTGEEVAKILSWKKTLRLPMPGALAEEQLAVLRHALKTGNVKHVLMELHPFFYQDLYRQQKQVLEDPDLYFPAFLYNETVLDDAGYVFNIDVLKASIHTIMRNSAAKPLNPETIGYWGDYPTIDNDHAEFNSPANIQKLKEQTSGFVLKAKTETEIESLNYPILKDTLFPLLKDYCNTDVEIVMFVPPWPRFRYQMSVRLTLRSIYTMRRILESSSHCANVSLYNFDLLDFVGDLNNFKDEQHYMPDINTKLLELISKHENRITMDNVGDFETRFINMLNHYSVYTSYVAPQP